MGEGQCCRWKVWGRFGEVAGQLKILQDFKKDCANNNNNNNNNINNQNDNNNKYYNNKACD